MGDGLRMAYEWSIRVSIRFQYEPYPEWFAI